MLKTIPESIAIRLRTRASNLFFNEHIRTRDHRSTTLLSTFTVTDFPYLREIVGILRKTRHRDATTAENRER